MHQMRHKLCTAQRTFLMMLGNFRKGTSGAALDVVLCIEPLHLQIEDEILKSRLRLEGKISHNWEGVWVDKQTTSSSVPKASHIVKKGQIRHADDLYSKAQLPKEKNDKTGKEIIWKKNFTIDEDSLKLSKDSDALLRVYTDGSKINGHTGMGAALLFKEEKPITASGYLGKYSTVFQAETKAILIACELTKRFLLDNATGENFHIPKVLIPSDSQTMIKALDTHKTKTASVKEAIEALHELSDYLQVKTKWIKAHVNHVVNELADKEAEIFFP